MASPSLTIFLPCFNDEKTIGELVSCADRVAKEFSSDYEILVIDDGSKDGSPELLRQLETRYPRFRAIFHPANQGYGAALQSGFRHATKEWIFYTDGDGQYDLFEVRNLFPLMQDGVDWINGYKISRKDPLYRIVAGDLYQKVAQRLFRFRVQDVHCDFRAIRRRALQGFQLRYTSGAICLELVKKLEGTGIRAVDYPVHHYPRPYGRSQFFRVPRLWKTGLDLIRLWKELKEEEKI